MRARLSVLLVTALVMVVTSLLTPVAFAQNQQRDPNEGEPKHEINELQNRLHQTEDRSKENHLENRIDALQDFSHPAYDMVRPNPNGSPEEREAYNKALALQKYLEQKQNEQWEADNKARDNARQQQIDEENRQRDRTTCQAMAAFSFGLYLLDPKCKGLGKGLF